MKMHFTAKVVNGNVPSMRLSQKNGFKVVGYEEDRFGYYILEWEKE